MLKDDDLHLNDYLVQFSVDVVSGVLSLGVGEVESVDRYNRAVTTPEPVSRCTVIVAACPLKFI